MRKLLPFALLALATQSFGQGLPLIDFGLRAGYTWSDRFTNGSGDRVRLEGFELGADVPLSSMIPGVKVNFSPSIFFAGQHSSGGDADGTVIRLHVTAMNPIGVGPVYSGGGLGWSFANARQNQFSDVNGFSAKFFVGYRLASGPVPVAPAVELAYHQAGKAQLRGFTLSLAAQF